MKKTFVLLLMCLCSVCGHTQDLNEFISSQICTEVCGVRFGSQYETAKEILKRKYGEPDYLDESIISYQYKYYGGINFSSIIFYFQRSENNSYMNKCVMGVDCRTVQEAKEKRDYIFSKVKEKYGSWTEDIDKNGFKYYEGGISPLGGEIGSGFFVDVVKFDKPDNGYKYFARIIYGSYNYVTEEF